MIDAPPVEHALGCSSTVTPSTFDHPFFISMRLKQSRRWQPFRSFLFAMDMSMIPSPEFLAENNGPTITATASLMIFFCTLFVGLRYYSRYLAGTAFNVEDMLVPLAWVAEIGLCIVGIGAQHLPIFIRVLTNTRPSHGRESRNRSTHGIHPLHRSWKDTRALQGHHDPGSPPPSCRRLPQAHRRPPLPPHPDAEVGARCR
jgi:hypothetical protein